MLDPEQKILSASELERVALGRETTLFVIPEEDETHPLLFVTTTSTTWPFVSELVVYVAPVPFWTLTPPTLKL
jgi:hypothetical protein